MMTDDIQRELTEHRAHTPAPRRLVRRHEVEARTGLSRSSIYERMAAGTFPKQVRLSPGSVGWVEDEVERWITDRIHEREQRERSQPGRGAARSWREVRA